MRDGFTLTDPMPLALPLSPYPLPTLNPDPEALLDFTCWALSQASVQPSIVRLGTGQRGQLLLGPHVHPSCHPTFWPILVSILLLRYKGRTGSPCSSYLVLFVCFISLGSALPGSPSGHRPGDRVPTHKTHERGPGGCSAASPSLVLTHP